MIESVTVYRRGARVRRAIPIEPGASEVRLANLPLVLEDASVRVRVEGEGARAVDVRVGVDVAPADPALAPPRDEELRAAEDAVAGARAEVARLERTASRLEALHIAGRPRARRGELPAPTPAEARVALARLASDEGARVAGELAAARGALRAVERRHTELADRARRATNARNTREFELRKNAVVRLEGDAPAGARLFFEYIVPGASWSPAYTVWLEGDHARVAMRAAVAQRSGEDWRGARLTLSTADPDRWAELPELAQIRIGRAQPAAPKRGYRAPPEGAEALYADYDRAFGRPAPEPPLMQTLVADAPMPKPAPQEHNVTRAGMMMLDEELMMPQAAPMARSKAAGIGAAIGGALLAPAALVAAALEKKPAAAPPAGGAGYRGRLAAEGYLPSSQRTPATVSFELDVETMAYARLVLRAADSSRRGELVASGVAESYGLAVRDMELIVRSATTHAEVDEPPPGHAAPRAPDAFDYAFEADAPLDVPSDGAFHVVSVFERRAPSSLRYVTVPREASDVFRLVGIQAGEIALLDGPADVYEGTGARATYLLSTRMPATPPGAKVELGLGVEQGIKVARNTTFAEHKEGFLGGDLALVHDISVELKNNLPRATSIEVRERIPTKRKDDDTIEIAIGPVEPRWEDWDQDDTLEGGRRWRVEIAAGGAATLAARYTVRIAAKNELWGGNRRES